MLWNRCSCDIASSDVDMLYLAMPLLQRMKLVGGKLYLIDLRFPWNEVLLHVESNASRILADGGLIYSPNITSLISSAGIYR